MYKMVLENEHALGIINGLHEIAGVRDYDLWVLGVALLAVIVSGIAATAAFILNKEQKNIAKTQADIAQKQAEIMEQQNKISLFEKRYKTYMIILNFYDSVSFVKTNLESTYFSGDEYEKIKKILSALLIKNIYEEHEKYESDLREHQDYIYKEFNIVNLIFNLNSDETKSIEKINKVIQSLTYEVSVLITKDAKPKMSLLEIKNLLTQSDRISFSKYAKSTLDEKIYEISNEMQNINLINVLHSQLNINLQKKTSLTWPRL